MICTVDEYIVTNIAGNVVVDRIVCEYTYSNSLNSSCALVHIASFRVSERGEVAFEEFYEGGLNVEIWDLWTGNEAISSLGFWIG